MSRSRNIGRSLRFGMRAALVASVGFPALSIGLGSFAFAQESPARSQTAPAASEQQAIAADVRATLSQFGSFVVHQKYGEVWIPSVTPQGWHPYMACQWKNDTKLGWYYDDATPWGAIVHHYGRWSHDEQAGWIWIPGAQFSPGWVVWRTSPEWVGWAPMPPDEDVHTATPAAFEKGDFWTFIDSKKFGSGCEPTAVVGPAQVTPILSRTTFVRDFEVVDGIVVAELPTYVTGPTVDLNIVFEPWPAWFFAQTLIDWNWFWNNVAITINLVNGDCPPPVHHQPPPHSPPLAKLPDPPPPPPIQTLPPPPPPISHNLPTPVTGTLCPNGGFANAYGACPPPTSACPPGLIVKGNFCVPPTTAISCPGDTRADGRGACVPIVTQSGCGPNAAKVAGRCVTSGPPRPFLPPAVVATPPATTLPPRVTTLQDPPVRHAPPPIAKAPPVFTPPRASPPTINLGQGGGVSGCRANPARCVVRPTSAPPIAVVTRQPPVMPRFEAPPRGRQPAPFVMGRGGGGLNLYSPNRGGPSRSPAPVQRPFRMAAQPVMHSMPAARGPAGGRGGPKQFIR
jgi:hypothetical protein